MWLLFAVKIKKRLTMDNIIEHNNFHGKVTPDRVKTGAENIL